MPSRPTSIATFDLCCLQCNEDPRGAPVARSMRTSAISLYSSRALVLGGLLALATRARAQDPFEIQVYDAEVLQLGEAMEELHLIAKPSVTNPPSGLPRDPGLLHLTFEPQIGLGGNFETAFYIETALWPDGSYHIAGAKLRAKWKLGPSEEWPVKLAINVEVGGVDTNSDQYAFSSEIRTIATTAFGPCRAFLNPTVGVPLGHDLHVGPSYATEAKFNCTALYGIAPGLEYYGEVGPGLAQPSHYLFYTLDVYRWPKVEIGVGVGEPLTTASGPWILNSNLGLQIP
jgi:hypothetical protein